MHTVIHGLISARTGEPVKITFTITDSAGAAVDVAAANAVYKIARRADGPSILMRTTADGIQLVSNTAVVEFDTSYLADADGPMTGDFFGQLTITKDGDGLVVAEGPIYVGPVIA